MHSVPENIDVWNLRGLNRKERSWRSWEDVSVPTVKELQKATKEFSIYFGWVQ
jgi:hypothetical protein